MEIQFPEEFLNQCPFFALLAIPLANFLATNFVSPPVSLAKSLKSKFLSSFSASTNFSTLELSFLSRTSKRPSTLSPIKPFDFAELEARCRAVLRRHRGQDQLALSFGNSTLYPLLAELEKDGERLSLRNRELKLLEIFFNSPNIIFSKEQLTDRLFSISEEVSENAIEVYVGRARKKLIGSDLIIETVRSMGYQLKKC